MNKLSLTIVGLFVSLLSFTQVTCEEVSVSFEGFVDIGIVLPLTWTLSTDGAIIQDGTVMLGSGMNESIELCLEDGCYNLSLTSPLPISEADWQLILGLAGSTDIPYTIVVDGNTAILEFGINDTCGEVDCPTSLTYWASDVCGCYVFQLGDANAAASVVWDFGDGTQFEGGTIVEHCFQNDGGQVISAT
ncbi:MAG: hypothetical protein HKN32_01875, partial [Flavobacteriales bacterium]|nr:hypothetical protein [Flavobacteriales bacterium]